MSVSINKKTNENIAEYRKSRPETAGIPDTEIISNTNTDAQQTAQTQQPAQNPSFVEDNTGLKLEKSLTDCVADGTDINNGETITDENGNEVFIETEDGEVIRRTIRRNDQSGNLIETIINYNGGKPVNKVEKKNGNTVSATEYTYHEESENSFEYVTLETEYPNRTRVKTNVLSTDEYGNYDDADFISETTTKPDGTTTEIIKYNGKIVETETRFDGTVTETVYNGSDLSEYHSGSLNRLEQTVTQNGSSTTVRYDGNGNTLTTVQNNEAPSQIAQNFHTTLKELQELNKDRKGKNSITQVGAEVSVLGEFDADSAEMRGRLSSDESIKKYAQAQWKILIKEIYSPNSIINRIKLERDYNNLYEFAKDKLIHAGTQNPTQDQINTEANKLILLNGENPKLNKGDEISVSTNLPDTRVVSVDEVSSHEMGVSTNRFDSENAKELSSLGIEQTFDNFMFYQEFAELEPAQQANIIDIIKSCKDQGITDFYSIGKEIYNKTNLDLCISEKLTKEIESQYDEQVNETVNLLKDDIYAKNSIGLPTTGKDIKEHIYMINNDNVLDVYGNYANETREGLLHAIITEYGLPMEEREEYIRHIFSCMKEYCEENGVYTNDIDNRVNTELKRQKDSVLPASGKDLDYLFTGLLDRFSDVPANGEIDEDFYQGKLADCWLLAGIKAIANNPQTLKILNDCIEVNEDDSVSVTLKGVNKKYTVSKSEIETATEFVNGDMDVRAIEIAVKKYFKENHLTDSTKVGAIDHNKAFEILLGIPDNRSFFEIAQETISYISSVSTVVNDELIDKVKSGKYLVIASSSVIAKAKVQVTRPDAAENIYNFHDYCIVKADDQYVYVVNPWDTSETLEYTHEEFKKIFDYAGVVSVDEVLNK